MARAVDRKDTLTMRRVRGMNDWDDPSSLPDDIATLVVNMQYHNGGLGRRRRGSVAVTVGGDAFTGVTYLANFVPAGGDPNAELFLVSGDTPKRLLISRTGPTATLLTADPVTGTDQFDTATLNNKLFIAYPSGINRLHVYVPGTTVVRQVGLTTPIAAPTATNSGAAGSYPADKRFYRIQWRVYAGGTLQRQSNLSAAVAFTPSGTAIGVDVARPAAPTDGTTHWALYVSADDATYYFLMNVPLATAVVLENVPFNTWDGELAPLEGAFTNWPSVKFLCSTGDRLLGFGVHASAATGDAMVPLNGRVYFS